MGATTTQTTGGNAETQGDGAAVRGRAVAVRERANAPLLTAPFRLFRYPAILMSVLVASVVLALATAAGPVFVSAAGSAALHLQVRETSRWSAGLTVVAYGQLGGKVSGEAQATLFARDLFRLRQQSMARHVQGLPGLDPGLLTIIGSKATVSTGAGRSAPVQLMSRTGFEQHVRVAQRGTRAGVWLSDTTAQQLKVEPGDAVTVRVRDRVAEAPVAVVYHDLAKERTTDYWQTVTEVIHGTPAAKEPPPPLLLAPVGPFFDIGAKLGELDQFTWQYPLTGAELGLGDARSLEGGINELGAELEDPSSEIGQLMVGGTHTSLLPDLVAQADLTAAGLKGPVGTVSLAGRLLALVVMGAAAVYAMVRRRTEVRLLMARGVHAALVGAGAAVEAMLPAAAGAAVGAFAGIWLVRTLGPPGSIEPSATASAIRQSVWMAVAALALLAAVAGASARRALEDDGDGRLGQGAARAPWEAVVLILAAASFYEIVTRGGGPVDTATGTAKVDVLLLLFPILFIAGVAGILGRLVRGVVWRLRGAGSRTRPAVFLAARRLATAGHVSTLLITACALAIGILAYGGTLSASVRATTRAKAQIFTGSDVAATLQPDARVPANLPFPATKVLRVADARALPDDLSVDLLGIDRGTFAAATSWDGSFAGRKESDLLAAITPIRALVAGPALSAGSTLAMRDFRISVSEVGQVRAFPGMSPGRTLVVVDAAALSRSLAVHETAPQDVGGHVELWAKGQPAEVVSALRRAGVRPETVRNVEQVQSSPSFLALTWAFGLLQVLGLLAGVLGVVGLVLYAQARQRAREVAYALSSRMGLNRGAHRAAVVLELGGMLVVAFVMGVALGVGAARLIYARLDVLPSIPPPALLRLPVAVFGVTGVALLAAAAAGAWATQRAADRANVAEVMRLAT